MNLSRTALIKNALLSRILSKGRKKSRCFRISRRRACLAIALAAAGRINHKKTATENSVAV